MLRRLFQAIRQLPPGKKLIILLAVLLVALTWLAVIMILMSYLVP